MENLSSGQPCKRRFGKGKLSTVKNQGILVSRSWQMSSLESDCERSWDPTPVLFLTGRKAVIFSSEAQPFRGKRGWVLPEESNLRSEGPLKNLCANHVSLFK